MVTLPAMVKLQRVYSLVILLRSSVAEEKDKDPYHFAGSMQIRSLNLHLNLAYFFSHLLPHPSPLIPPPISLTSQPYFLIPYPTSFPSQPSSLKLHLLPQLPHPISLKPPPSHFIFYFSSLIPSSSHLLPHPSPLTILPHPSHLLHI